MNPKKLLALAGAAVVILGAGIWLSHHRSNQRGDLGGGAVFPDLKPALGEVEEIRLSKGDGSRTTLRKTPEGWIVVERNYAADGARVRELAMAFANLKIVELKTQDPANYAKLGVEAPDSPTAASTLIEIVAGKKTWPLIVGKSAEGRAIYVRKPGEPASALAEPSVTVDPDQKRWIDRLLIDLPGASVHAIAVKPATGPAYLLTRNKRGDTDLVMSPIPKGRTAASSMSIEAQADALAALNFDDVRALPAIPAATVDHATYRTFDGQVIEFAGRHDGAKAFVTVNARRDAALAAQFPAPVPAGAAAKPADRTVERLAARGKGVEFEVPVYKYEAIFKPQEELLEKKPEPQALAKTKK
jgi:hypothetical protein